MSVIVHLLVNIFILLSAFVPLIISGYIAFFQTTNLIERLLRGLAIFAAGMLVIGADAAGLNLGRFAVRQLSEPGFGGVVLKILFIVIFAAAGIGSAVYLVTKLESNTTIASRVVVFVGVFAHAELLDIYLNAFKYDGFAIGPGAIPGAAFLVGMIFYIMLHFDPDAPGGGSVRRLRRGLARRSARSGSAIPPLPSERPPPRPRDRVPPPEDRMSDDPFDYPPDIR